LPDIARLRHNDAQILAMKLRISWHNNASEIDADHHNSEGSNSQPVVHCTPSMLQKLAHKS